jgi:DNA-binding MarR family transcriptional regulator
MELDAHAIAQQILAIVPPVMRTVAAELRRTDRPVSPAHFGTLYTLSVRPCNLSELAEQQGVSPPTISNTVASLVTRGLVQRTRSREDRRVVVIELTQAGQEHLARVSRQAEERVEAMLEGLSETDRQALVEGLAVLQRIFSVHQPAAEIGRNPQEPE